MFRQNIMISEGQHAWLKEQAEARGLSMSEICRRALTSYEAMQASDLNPDDPRARYIQLVGEHMGELVAAVLEGLASKEVRALLRRGQGDRIRQLEEKGELADWLLDEGKFQDESHQDESQESEKHAEVKS